MQVMEYDLPVCSSGSQSLTMSGLDPLRTFFSLQSFSFLTLLLARNLLRPLLSCRISRLPLSPRRLLPFRPYEQSHPYGIRTTRGCFFRPWRSSTGLHCPLSAPAIPCPCPGLHPRRLWYWPRGRGVERMDGGKCRMQTSF